MKIKSDIAKYLRVMFLLVGIICFLPSCTKDTSDPHKGAGTSGETLSCWQEDVLKPVFDVISTTTMSMFKQLSQGASSVVWVGFAIWLSFQIIKFVSSMAEENSGELWNAIFHKAFVCAICATLASSPEMLLYTLNFFIFPIYHAFLDFGAQILGLATGGIKEVKEVVIMGETAKFPKATFECAVKAGTASATMKGFPEGFRDAMGCMVCAVATRLQLGREVAFVAMAMGGILAFVVGFALWIIFIIVGCCFVFYLVDSIFRFGIMVLLLPILIAAYPFEQTREWTNKGFKGIMVSAAFMMAFSIMVSTALMAMVVTITENYNIFSPSADDNVVRQFLSELSVPSLCLLCIGFLVYGSTKVASQLTQMVIGAQPSTEFQQKAKAALQTVFSIVSGGIGAVFKNFTPVGQVTKGIGEMKSTLNKMAGRK